MKYYYQHKRKQHTQIQHYGRTCICIALLYATSVGFSLSTTAIAKQVGGLDEENVKLGQVNQSSLPLSELISTLTSTQSSGTLRAKINRVSSLNAKREQNNNDNTHNNARSSTISEQQSQLNNNLRKLLPINSKVRQGDILSTDCLAKRNEILNRQVNHQQQPQQQPQQQQTGATTTTRLLAANNSGYQRLKPKHDVAQSFAAGTAATAITPQQAHSINVNETLQQFDNNLSNEHVPKCNQQGGYQPIQCHKIGYCWCVNKYGQAIKNTAVMAGDEPYCDPSMYESDSNDWVVVAGVSAQKMNHFLKNVSSFESTTPNGHLNFEAPEVSPTEDGNIYGNSDIIGGIINDPDHGHQLRPKVRGPIMPLIPNDCKSSRDNARERAHKYMNDSIWIPDCDLEHEKLYAERQCHKTKVCWCVDQTTGLPLRASEQLTNQRSTANNCTGLKKLIDLSSQPKVQAAFYMGSSEHCDADKRVDFIISLNNQFRQQISEYMRQNPSSLNNLPQGISSTNPFAISELQVSKWKFTIMDRDSDGRLGDREWSKFKNNFKLVDRVDELDNPFKQQKSPYFNLTPLLILRDQRKCWRDFLEFCGSGDLLIDESISINKWHSCTEVPSKRPQNGSVDEFSEENQYHSNNRGSSTASLENTYAHSREAAITRSKKKNPFLQILRPD